MESLKIFNHNPKLSFKFAKNNGTDFVGELFENDKGLLEFKGDAEESAEILFNSVCNMNNSQNSKLKEENAELRKSLELMVDFAEGQMHPEQNDPSMFDDEDFGNLKRAKQLLNK